MLSARSARRRELANGAMPQEDLVARSGDCPQVGLPIVGWFVEGLKGFGVQRIDQAENQLILVPEMPIDRGRMCLQLSASA
jgi:hypothetical protein